MTAACLPSGASSVRRLCVRAYDLGDISCVWRSSNWERTPHRTTDTSVLKLFCVAIFVVVSYFHSSRRVRLLAMLTVLKCCACHGFLAHNIPDRSSGSRRTVCVRRKGGITLAVKNHRPPLSPARGVMPLFSYRTKKRYAHHRDFQEFSMFQEL